jgi:RHS repeat-associated protein
MLLFPKESPVSYFLDKHYTGKQLDDETGLIYFGARYLDPQASMWLSADPAMGEYVPAPGKGADGLPGMGGVYNSINLHTYHYAGNNPVKYTDPDGRDDVYYNTSGQYVETIQSETSDVYLRGTTGENTRITTASEFNKFTAAVLGESSGNATESEALEHVIMNRSGYTGRSISDIIDNTGIYGYTGTNQTVADNGATSDNNTNLANARAGVIHAFTGNDTSNGAYFWEGTTFLNPESPLYNQNNWFVRSGWGTTPGTDGIINYLETTTIGGTVFMYNNPQYHGNRRYP